MGKYIKLQDVYAERNQLEDILAEQIDRIEDLTKTVIKLTSLLPDKEK